MRGKDKVRVWKGNDKFLDRKEAVAAALGIWPRRLNVLFS